MTHVVSHFFPVILTGPFFVFSARIVLLRVSGATRHVRAKDAKSMVSRTRVWTACVRLEKLESSAVLTNVKAKHQLLRHLRIQVSSGLPGLYPTSHFFSLGFPPNGEGSWVAPSDQADSALPGATPAIAAQYMPPEGYWPYPYYPPPPGYVPPPPDGHANGDGAPHGQPPHPAYYPIHPGYPPVPIYPPPPGAYGPIPTLPGQTPATEQTASNQAATSDDERAVVERPKKKKRVGGEEGVAKSGKKSKRGTNTTGDAPTAVVTVPAPASDDSPDDHGSPVAHNGSGNVGGEPLPPVIAAA